MARPEPPPMPDGAIPVIFHVPLMSRATGLEAWRGCFQSGVEVGEPIGFAKGVAFMALGQVALVSVAVLVAFLILRSRKP